MIGQASIVYGIQNHVTEKRDQQIILRLLSCRKSSINPPWGAYLFPAHLRGEGGGLNRDGGLFNSEKMMVSVLHKELGYKVEKLRYKKIEGHAAEDQNQIRAFRW